MWTLPVLLMLHFIIKHSIGHLCRPQTALKIITRVDLNKSMTNIADKKQRELPQKRIANNGLLSVWTWCLKDISKINV